MGGIAALDHAAALVVSMVLSLTLMFPLLDAAPDQAQRFLAGNLTRRVDYALFMVEALENDALIHEAPAIVGCRTPSALAHAAIQ